MQFVIPAQERQRQIVPRGLPACQSSLLGDLQTSGRPCPREQGGWRGRTSEVATRPLQEIVHTRLIDLSKSFQTLKSITVFYIVRQWCSHSVVCTCNLGETLFYYKGMLLRRESCLRRNRNLSEENSSYTVRSRGKGRSRTWR